MQDCESAEGRKEAPAVAALVLGNGGSRILDLLVSESRFSVSASGAVSLYVLWHFHFSCFMARGEIEVFIIFNEQFLFVNVSSVEDRPYYDANPYGTLFMDCRAFHLSPDQGSTV